MRRPTMLQLASAILRHLGLGAYGEALMGDLLEEFERTGSASRFRREIVAAALGELWRRCGEWLRALAFAAGWSLLYPVWQAMEGGRVWPAMAQRSYSMEWPYSSVTLLASAGLPPLLFVWCGALLYMARNHFDGDWVETGFRVIRGLSLSLSVLLVCCMVLLHARSGGSSGYLVGDASGSSGVRLPAVSVSLMLSVLAGTLSARPARVRLQAR